MIIKNIIINNYKSIGNKRDKLEVDEYCLEKEVKYEFMLDIQFLSNKEIQKKKNIILVL